MDIQPICKKSKPEVEQSPSEAENRNPNSKRDSYFLSTPLELLLEVVHHVDPRSWLRLARTNKCLRDIIKGPRCEFMWKESLEMTAHAPPFPEDISLWRYVHYVFETDCQNCNSEEILDFHWASRVRMCDECLRNVLMQEPFPPPPRHNISRHVWDAALDHFGINLKCSKWINRFVPSEVVLSLADALRALSTHAEQQEYVTQLIGQCSSMHVEWFKQENTRRKQERRAIILEKERIISENVSERFNGFIPHLVKLGYESELSKSEVKSSLLRYTQHLYNKDPEITDWSLIQDGVVKHMESIRYVEALVPRFLALKAMLDGMKEELGGLLAPQQIDVALLPEIKAILDLPAQESIPESALLDIRDEIPAALERWHQRVFAGLAKSNASLRPIFEKFGTLDHPATVFLCKKCKRPRDTRLTYSTLFLHPCQNVHQFSRPSLPETFESIGSLYEFAAERFFDHKPWAVDTLEVHDLSDRIKDMLRACDVDPDQISWEDMDQMDPRLQCIGCEHKVRGLTMGWRTAIEHVLYEHVCGVDPTWRLASELDSVLARQLEQATEAMSREEYPDYHMCLICHERDCPGCNRERSIKARLLQDHFENKHRTRPLVLNQTYMKDPEAYPFVPLPVAIIPAGLKRLTGMELSYLYKGRARIQDKPEGFIPVATIDMNSFEYVI